MNKYKCAISLLSLLNIGIHYIYYPLRIGEYFFDLAAYLSNSLVKKLIYSVLS